MPATQTTTRRGPSRSRTAASHRYAGPSQHPLTTKQKGIICKIARRAYTHVRASGSFEEWRRDQQSMAVGVGSLTACTQNDYLPLVAHFEGLAGEGGQQFNAAYRHQDESLRQAQFLLAEALRIRGLDPSYAEAICRQQYRRDLEDATVDQLFQLRFTVEARRPVVQQPAPASDADPF